MERNFSRDLTIMIAGTGKITNATLREELDDWVFGTADSREVKLVIPIMNRPTPGMRFMVDWAIDVDADVQVVQALGAGMTKELAALDDIIRKDTEQEVLDECFKIMLERQKAGDEVAFIMTYDKTSVYTQGDHNMSDLEILCEAKNYTWLPTLNAEIMADLFEGYESTDDRIKREAAEKEYAEREAAAKAAAKPAKKAAAPRKKAAPKAEPTPVVNEPEKPTSGLDKLISDAVARDTSQPKELELSANVDVTPKLVHVSTEDVWADVAKARPAAVESRQEELFIQLGEQIAQMGEVFSQTIRTYAALGEEIRNG